MSTHALPHRPAIGRILSLLVHAFRLRRSRRSLARLDPHLLCDIGLTRDQAVREALRPLWDAPEAWRQKDEVTDQ